MKMNSFHFILIKPSHYDDEGYVIQWGRSAIPSNSLAVLNSLAMDCSRRRVLGDDVRIVVHVYDETNTLISIPKILRTVRSGIGGLVGLVGVQTNQFPRAVDIGLPLVQAQIPVVIGGFHVSGSLAMLPRLPVDLQSAMDLGITLFAGEAEGHLDEVLHDAFQRKKPKLYNFLKDTPSLEQTPAPFLPASVVKKTFGRMTSFDAGRGCPYQCSFCTIINVQGRTSRYRSPDDIELIVRANLAQGVWRFFITDDDFARNREWERILDRLIHLREVEGLRISLAIQVDALCHKIPSFIEKAVRAGCYNVFIGLENLNPQSLAKAKKGQNKIWEYRRMLQEWKKHGCTVVAGYIIGFPLDTPQSIAQDIEIIKQELPVDLLEFFCLTPLPGSEDHKKLFLQGEWMDPDMNNYDLEHVTTHHPLMSKSEWQEAYRRAWSQYYTWEHMEVLLRRAAATGQSVIKVMFFLGSFYASIMLHGIHPLEGGSCRLKVRRRRRPGLPIEGWYTYYPKRIKDFVLTSFHWVRIFWKLNRLRRRVEADPHKRDYMDVSLTPVAEEENPELKLFSTYGEPVFFVKKRSPKGTLSSA